MTNQVRFKFPSVLLLLTVVGIFSVFCFAEPATHPPEGSTVPISELSPDVERIRARCLRVFSGERIEVEGALGGVMKIAYLGVAVPGAEDPDPLRRTISKKAFQYNRELVENKSVMLEFESTEPDASGRLAAYVFVDKTFVNGELVRQGYAEVTDTKPDCQLKEFFLKQQTRAKDEELGLWADMNAQSVPPIVRPTPLARALPDSYVGTINSNIFHHPDCQWAKKIKAENRLVYTSRDEAVAEGRRPCQTCKP